VIRPGGQFGAPFRRVRPPEAVYPSPGRRVMRSGGPTVGRSGDARTTLRWLASASTLTTAARLGAVRAFQLRPLPIPTKTIGYEYRQARSSVKQAMRRTRKSGWPGLEMLPRCRSALAVNESRGPSSRCDFGEG
jgi:hypothetical protein